MIVLTLNIYIYIYIIYISLNDVELDDWDAYAIVVDLSHSTMIDWYVVVINSFPVIRIFGGFPLIPQAKFVVFFNIRYLPPKIRRGLNYCYTSEKLGKGNPKRNSIKEGFVYKETHVEKTAKIPGVQFQIPWFFGLIAHQIEIFVILTP
jgi:hypothetical protein